MSAEATWNATREGTDWNYNGNRRRRTPRSIIHARASGSRPSIKYREFEKFVPARGRLDVLSNPASGLLENPGHYVTGTKDLLLEVAFIT